MRAAVLHPRDHSHSALVRPELFVIVLGELRLHDVKVGDVTAARVGLAADRPENRERGKSVIGLK